MKEDDVFIKKAWARVYDLGKFTVETLDFEGNWRPERYNQETEWSDEDLQDWIYGGDGSEDYH